MYSLQYFWLVAPTCKFQLKPREVPKNTSEPHESRTKSTLLYRRLPSHCVVWVKAFKHTKVWHSSYALLLLAFALYTLIRIKEFFIFFFVSRVCLFLFLQCIPSKNAVFVWMHQRQSLTFQCWILLYFLFFPSFYFAHYFYICFFFVFISFIYIYTW